VQGASWLEHAAVAELEEAQASSVAPARADDGEAIHSSATARHSPPTGAAPKARGERGRKPLSDSKPDRLQRRSRSIPLICWNAPGAGRARQYAGTSCRMLLEPARARAGSMAAARRSAARMRSRARRRAAPAASPPRRGRPSASTAGSACSAVAREQCSGVRRTRRSPVAACARCTTAAEDAGVFTPVKNTPS